MEEPRELGQRWLERELRTGAPLSCGKEPRAVTLDHRAATPLIKLLRELLWCHCRSPALTGYRKPLRSPFDELRANGLGLEVSAPFPLVLSLLKHENPFFSTLLRNVYDLELDAVRIGEEHGIVARDIVVLAWWIENPGPVRLKFLGQLIDLRPAFASESDLADADPVLVKRVGCEAGVGLLDPEAAGLGGPAPGATEVMDTCRVAHSGHEPVIKAARALVVVDVDDSVVDSSC